MVELLSQRAGLLLKFLNYIARLLSLNIVKGFYIPSTSNLRVYLTTYRNYEYEYTVIYHFKMVLFLTGKGDLSFNLHSYIPSGVKHLHCVSVCHLYLPFCDWMLIAFIYFTLKVYGFVY